MSGSIPREGGSWTESEKSNLIPLLPGYGCDMTTALIASMPSGKRWASNNAPEKALPFETYFCLSHIPAVSTEHCENEGCPAREKSMALQLLSLLRTDEGEEGSQHATESPATEKGKVGSRPTD